MHDPCLSLLMHAVDLNEIPQQAVVGLLRFALHSHSLEIIACILHVVEHPFVNIKA